MFNLKKIVRSDLLNLSKTYSSFRSYNDIAIESYLDSNENAYDFDLSMQVSYLGKSYDLESVNLKKYPDTNQLSLKIKILLCKNLLIQTIKK